MTLAEDLLRILAKRNIQDDPVRLATQAATIMRAPDVHAYRHQDIFKQGDLYLRRWFLGVERFSRVFLHEIRTSDTEPDQHDHPWDYSSFILRGGYDEETPAGTARAGTGDLVERSGEHLHRLILQKSPTWTLIVVGARRRRWGFMTSKGWVDFEAYEPPGQVNLGVRK